MDAIDTDQEPVMRRYLPYVLCLLSTSLGCQPRDNPYDPGRCEPRCQAGETCYEGHCLRADLGLDLNLDRGVIDSGATELGKADGAAPGYAMSSKQCKGEVTTNAVTPGLISCVDGSEFQVMVTASGTDRYLFLLNAPDTWVDGDYKSAEFQIVDIDAADKKTVITSGGYSTKAQQRIPTTVAGTRKLSAGTHTIQVWWGVGGGTGPEKAHIGATGAWLIVLPAPDSDLQSVYGSQQPTQKADGNWSDLPISSDPPIEIKAKEQAGKYLLMLNAKAYTDGADQVACFQLVVDHAAGQSQPFSSGCFSSGYIGQRIMMPVIGVQDLALGDKIRAQWSVWGKPAHLEQANGTTWLIALRTPKDITKSDLPWVTPDLATTSLTPQAIPGFTPLDVVSSGGDYLFILSVPLTWTNLSAAASAYYQVQIAGATEFKGFFSSASTDISQHIPVTIAGVKKLPFAGSHNKVEAWWGVTKCMESSCTAALKLNMATLVALTR